MLKDNNQIQSPQDITKNIQQNFEDFLNTTDLADMRVNENSLVISTGNEVFDIFCGGGIHSGNLIQLVGRPGCGKSAFAGNICAALQNQYKDAIVVYIDTELTTDTKRMKDLGMINTPKPLCLTIEGLFDIIDKLIEFKKSKNIVETTSYIIWDSVANTGTNKHATAETINQIIGYRANVISQMLPSKLFLMKKFNITLIAINQVRDKIEMGLMHSVADLKYLDSGITIPGGKSLHFNTLQMVILKQGKKIDSSKYGFSGFECECQFVKNKRFIPDVKFKMIYDHVRGFSNFWSKWTMLAEAKKITVGAWCRLNGYEKTFRSAEAEELYLSNSEFKTAFDEVFNSHRDGLIESLKELQSKRIQNGSDTNEIVIEGEGKLNLADIS